jgi:hypothetical protein
VISRAQQILLKRAQAQAGLDDGDYRDAIESVAGMAGCRSSKDARLTDSHVDRLMGYFEAIYWRGVDAGALQEPSKVNAVFRQRGFWGSRNPAGNTSRDRFTGASMEGKIEAAEAELAALGFGPGYLAAIRRRMGVVRLIVYLAALNRTLRAKRRHELH